MRKMLVLGLMVAMCLLTVGCNKNKTAREVRPVPMPSGAAAGNTYGAYSSSTTTTTTTTTPGATYNEPMSVQGVTNQTNYVASPESPYIELPAVSVNQGGMEPIVQPTGEMTNYDAGTTVAPSTYTFSDQPMESTPTPNYVQPTTPAPVPTPAAASAVHVVAKGDTLWRIAKQYYNDGKRWTDIARANNISDPNRIYVGMKLTIPR